MNLRKAALLGYLSVMLALAVPVEAEAQRSNAAAHSEESVRAYLRDRLASLSDRDPDARYALAWADLNGDGRNEAIVRVMSRSLCGTGGCNMYVLSPYRWRWRLVGRMTITKLPIRVLDSRSHGWRDLGVWHTYCCENNQFVGYEALMPFDGRVYASNPSISPSRRLRRAVPGTVLISSSDRGKPLF